MVCTAQPESIANVDDDRISTSPESTTSCISRGQPNAYAQTTGSIAPALPLRSRWSSEALVGRVGVMCDAILDTFGQARNERPWPGYIATAPTTQDEPPRTRSTSAHSESSSVGGVGCSWLLSVGSRREFVISGHGPLAHPRWMKMVLVADVGRNAVRSYFLGGRSPVRFRLVALSLS
jgi:hypothetical protein